MSSRFEYRPLVLALLALQSAPVLAEEAASAAAEAPAAAVPATPEPAAAPVTTPAAPELSTVTVKAENEATYKADTVSSPKFTQPLLDTPQTITVIKKEILQEQGAVSLMEALRNTPGITVQLGENGNTSTGDAFTMRGFSTQTSTFVDGIRDLGAITRDTFNLEAVEVAKGPAGADIGRGASSGYINLVTKLPTLDGGSSGTVSLNSANNLRLTLDSNEKIGETTAVRLNVMGQNGGVVGRDAVEQNGWAVAPSFATGLGTDTRLYVYYQHVQQGNVPDGGIPSIGLPGYTNATPALNGQKPVARENFYGGTFDYENVTADMFTVSLEKDLGDSTTLRNTSRYGVTTMDRTLTSINTSNTGISVNGQPTNPAAWTVTRTRQGVDQTNDILANQTNLTTAFATGGLKHSLSTGLELMYEGQQNLTFATVGTVPPANLYDPNMNTPMPNPTRTGAGTNGQTKTISAYVFDTIDIGEYFQVNGGVRGDAYRTESSAFPAGTTLADKGNLISWQVGTLVKPAENGSIYAAYSTSQTPPGSANFSLATGANSASNPKFDPQITSNIEVGTKWDVLNQRLALTAAVYQTDNENEITYDPVSLVYTQEGKTRVKGVELGAVGQITPAWQISAGIATMDTEVLENRTTTANNSGNAVRWSPELSATLWTTYKLTDAFTVGGGARYMGEQKRVVTPSVAAGTNMPLIPDYWVVDAMASYKFSPKLAVRANLYNVLDEDYIATLNNAGSRVTMGAPISGALSLDFQF